MQTAFSWAMTPCNLVQYYLLCQEHASSTFMVEELKMEAVDTSEKLVRVTQNIMIFIIATIRISNLNMKHIMEREQHNGH